MPRRWLTTFLAILSLVLGGVAHAKEEEGTLITVQVVDEGGHAIPNAWVRVPDTEGRRGVDPKTGIWSARYLYRFDGSEYYFKRNMVLKMTISAPGYQPRVARYRVRRGKNMLHVTLAKLPSEQAKADTDISWFRRDSEPRPQAAPPAPPEPAAQPEPPAETKPAKPDQKKHEKPAPEAAAPHDHK